MINLIEMKDKYFNYINSDLLLLIEKIQNN